MGMTVLFKTSMTNYRALTEQLREEGYLISALIVFHHPIEGVFFAGSEAHSINFAVGELALIGKLEAEDINRSSLKKRGFFPIIPLEDKFDMKYMVIDYIIQVNPQDELIKLSLDNYYDMFAEPLADEESVVDEEAVLDYLRDFSDATIDTTFDTLLKNETYEVDVQKLFTKMRRDLEVQLFAIEENSPTNGKADYQVVLKALQQYISDVRIGFKELVREELNRQMEKGWKPLY